MDLSNLIIDETKRVFEENFTNPPHAVHERALRSTDEAYCIGIILESWQGIPSSALIGTREPNFFNYNLRIQNMLKNVNEVDGRRVFYTLCALVRQVLYRSGSLEVALLGASEQVKQTNERIKKLDVVQQTYLNSRMQGSFTYLCSTSAIIQVEALRAG